MYMHTRYIIKYTVAIIILNCFFVKSKINKLFFTILSPVLFCSFCIIAFLMYVIFLLLRMPLESQRSQDGGGIGRGGHFLSYKFIKRTIERWTKFPKQLLIASSGHQAPRKAAHCLRREVGQNIKDKKRDKRARDGDPSWEGSLNRGSFQPPGNPRAGRSEGSFQISEGNLTGRKN